MTVERILLVWALTGAGAAWAQEAPAPEAPSTEAPATEEGSTPEDAAPAEDEEALNASAKFVDYGGSDEERARELYDNGEVLYSEGKYATAITAWEEAYSLSPQPLLLFNIANAYERMGAWKLAIDQLDKYRAFAEEDERTALDRRLASLEERLAAEEAEQAPKVVEEVVPQASQAEIEEVVSMDLPDKVFDEPEVVKHRLKAVPFSFLGAGAVTMLVGAGFGNAAEKARSEGLGFCVDRRGDLLCGDGAVEPLERSRSAALAADVSLATGGALALTGVVLGIFTGFTNRVVQVSPTVGAGAAGVQAEGKF